MRSTPSVLAQTVSPRVNALLGVTQGLVGAHDTDLVAILADDADLGNADALIDPGRIALGWAPVEPSGNRHLDL